MAELNIDKMAHNVAEKVIDEILYQGKSIREWMQIITSEVINDLSSINLQEPLTEKDYIELRDRFGEYVVFVVRDMVSGKGERWKQKNDNNPQYCDRNICVSNEYNGIGCDECEVMAESEGDE